MPRLDPRADDSLGASHARGHTLVELLAGTMLASILVLIVTQFYLATNTATALLSAQATLQMQTLNAQRSLVKDIQEARSIDDLISMPRVGGGTWTPDSNTLILFLPSLDAAGNPFVAGDGGVDAVIYDYNTATGVLTRYVQPDIDPPNTSTRPTAYWPNNGQVVANYLRTDGVEPGVLFTYETGGGPRAVKIDLVGFLTQRGPSYRYKLRFRGRPRNATN